MSFVYLPLVYSTGDTNSIARLFIGSQKETRREVKELTSVPGAKLALGQTVMTQGVASEIATDRKFSDFVLSSIDRHIKGDWGNLSEEDKAENNYALSRQLRVLSAYEMEGLPKIWIITEADRSATTVLFPDEY